MLLGELIDRIDRAGWLVVVKDGRPLLRVQPGDPEPDGSVREGLAEHRDYFLSLGPGGDESGELPILDPPLKCQECKLFVHCGHPATVFALCGHLGCPFWCEGMGPPWFGKDRWWFFRKRAEKAADERRLEEGIPE